MDWLIWIGTAISLIGLGGLVWCMVRVFKAKRAGLSDEALKAEVQRVVPINMAALAFSVLGLISIVIGIALG